VFASHVYTCVVALFSSERAVSVADRSPLSSPDGEGNLSNSPFLLTDAVWSLYNTRVLNASLNRLSQQNLATEYRPSKFLMLLASGFPDPVTYRGNVGLVQDYEFLSTSPNRVNISL